MFGLRALFHKERAERDMDDELRFHLGKQAEQNVARGMRPHEARCAALSCAARAQRKERSLIGIPKRGVELGPKRKTWAGGTWSGALSGD